MSQNGEIKKTESDPCSDSNGSTTQVACPCGEINAQSAYPRIPIPNMTENNIEYYFMSLDFWFKASGVGNDDRQYNTTLAQIPVNRLPELKPIIDATPLTAKYNYIKNALITHFSDSQQRRLQKVLSDMPLCDKKPSQLYHDMARVAGTTLGESALLDLWAARLPPYAQSAVVAAKSSPLVTRLEIADGIVESISFRNVSSISSDITKKCAGQEKIDFSDVSKLRRKMYAQTSS